jgi:hypothetical protein
MTIVVRMSEAELLEAVTAWMMVRGMCPNGEHSMTVIPEAGDKAGPSTYAIHVVAVPWPPKDA